MIGREGCGSFGSIRRPLSSDAASGEHGSLPDIGAGMSAEERTPQAGVGNLNIYLVVMLIEGFIGLVLHH